MGSFCGANAQTVSTALTNPNTTNQQNALYSLGQGIYNQYAQNPASLVADTTDTQKALINQQSQVGAGLQPWSAQAANLAGSGAGYLQSAAGPTSLTAWNPQAYENPYTNSVVNSTLANFDRNADITNNQSIGNFIKNGNAFGGDRAGVALAEDRRNQALSRGQLEAGIRNQGFQQASQTALAEQNLALQNDQANAQRMLGVGQSLGNLGQAYGNIATSSAQAQTAANQAAMNAAGVQQQTNQAIAQAPYTNLGFLTANSPGTQAAPTSTTYPGANPLGTIAGLGIAGAGIYNSLSQADSPAGGSPLGGGLATGGRIERAHGGGAYNDGYVSPMDMFKDTVPQTGGLSPYVNTNAQPVNVAGTGQTSGSTGFSDAIGMAAKFLPLLLLNKGGSVDGGSQVDNHTRDMTARLEHFTNAFDRMRQAKAASIPDIGREHHAFGDAVGVDARPGDQSQVPPWQNNNGPWGAGMRDPMLMMGLNILAGAGARDAHGLPTNPMAQIGKGAQTTAEMVAAQDKEAQQRYMLARRLEQEAMLQKQRLAQEAAIAAGQAPGYGQTLAAKAQPSLIALHEAQAQAARTQSDKEFLLSIEKQKMEYQKQLQLEQQEKEWALLQRLKDQQKNRQQNGPASPPSFKPGGSYIYDATRGRYVLEGSP